MVISFPRLMAIIVSLPIKPNVALQTPPLNARKMPIAQWLARWNVLMETRYMVYVTSQQN